LKGGVVKKKKPAIIGGASFKDVWNRRRDEGKGKDKELGKSLFQMGRPDR